VYTLFVTALQNIL